MLRINVHNPAVFENAFSKIPPVSLLFLYCFIVTFILIAKKYLSGVYIESILGHFDQEIETHGNMEMEYKAIYCVLWYIWGAHSWPSHF